MSKTPALKALKFIQPYLRRIYIAFALLGLSLMTGTLGFQWFEDYTLLEAYYMTVITLGTVGYGEVKPLSDTGRLFAAFLILFNLGIFTYAITAITAAFLDGHFLKMLKRYHMLKKINTLQGHVILCGYGRHGSAVAAELVKAGRPFVIIETKKELLATLTHREHLFIEGDATHDEVLLEAGVMSAHTLVVTLGGETENVYVVLSARQLNPNLNIISRALSVQSEAKLLRAGANHIVMPERIGGFFMATLIQNPNVVEFLSILSNMGKTAAIAFEEIPCGLLRPRFQGQTLGALDIHTRTGANVIGMHLPNGEYLVNPALDTVPQAGSKLIVLGNSEQMARFKTELIEGT